MAIFKDKTAIKEFLKYVPLSVFAMIAMSCYILADTYFISQGLGVYGLSSLNLTIPVYYFIHGIGLMLGMGGATRYSVCRSRGDGKEADKAFTSSLCAGVVFAVIFVVAGAVFPAGLATLFGADENTLHMTTSYLRVLLLFSPAFILNNILTCFVRNDGAPRLAMLSTVAGSLSNVLLDWIFIFVCRWGMFGAAFATGLAPIIGIAISSVHLLRRKNNFKAVKGVPSLKFLFSMFALGIPSLIEQFSSAVVILVFNFIILGLNGNDGVAAYGVVANISLVIASVFTGIAQGIQPLVSRSHGSGDGRGGAYFILALIFAALFSALVYVLIYFYAEPIADIFNREKQPSLTEMAADGMRIYFIAIPFVGYNVTASAFFSSSEKPVPAQVISVLRGLVLIIPAAYLFSEEFGLIGVWISYPFTEAVVFIVASIVLFAMKRRIK